MLCMSFFLSKIAFITVDGLSVYHIVRYRNSRFQMRTPNHMLLLNHNMIAVADIEKTLFYCLKLWNKNAE